jgi:hypothetical protein
MKVKTIDVNAKEWFDKYNGNSYFSAVVTTNYGTKQQKTYNLPFQYGYGEHYIDIANQLLIKEGVVNTKRNDNGSYNPLWQYCRDNKIILRTYKQENCKKRELNLK